MAGQPRTRAKRAAQAAAAAAAGQPVSKQRVAKAPAVHPAAAQPLPPDAHVVALAGAMLLGRYRGTIAASHAPLATSLQVLDEQLPDEVARVRRQLGAG